MAKVNPKLDILKNIKEKITIYLKETSLEDLKNKIQEAENITKLATDAWQTVNWEDLPDAETIGYEGIKQQALDLRDDIKSLIQPRITELEIEEAKSELAGAQAQQTLKTTTLDSQLQQLKEIFDQFEEDYDTYTKSYVQAAPLTVLETKLKTIDIMKETFKENR